MLLIENPEFSEMRGMFNQVMDSLLRRMLTGDGSQGSVTLKINIELRREEVEGMGRLAVIPDFSYNVTSNLPQKITTKGTLLLGAREIVDGPAGIALNRVPVGQMRLEDYEEEQDDGMA